MSFVWKERDLPEVEIKKSTGGHRERVVLIEPGVEVTFGNWLTVKNISAHRLHFDYVAWVERTLSEDELARRV